MDRLKDDITKMETNMSFFANADESNPLLKTALQNLENSKSEMEGLKELLKSLNILEREMENRGSEEATEEVETGVDGSNVEHKTSDNADSAEVNE